MPAEYTLSIIPEGEPYARLHGVIKHFAGRYDTPVFEPHITILGDIQAAGNEIAKKSRQLAGEIRPFSARLSEPVSGESFFKCVYLQADENPELMKAGGRARELFGRQGEPFRPHLSLVYGTYPEETRRTIVSEIGDSGMEFDAGSLWLVHSSDTIPIENWHRIIEFPFSG